MHLQDGDMPILRVRRFEEQTAHASCYDVD